MPARKLGAELAFDTVIAARERTRLIAITNLLFEEYSGVRGPERLVDASRPPNSHPGSAHAPSKHICLCHLAAPHSSTTREQICLLRLVGEHAPKSPIGHGARPTRQPLLQRVLARSMAFFRKKSLTVCHLVRLYFSEKKHEDRLPRGRRGMDGRAWRQSEAGWWKTCYRNMSHGCTDMRCV